MKKHVFIRLALSLVILSLIAWSWSKFHRSSVDDAILRLALDDKVESLDPAKAFSDDSLLVCAQVLEPLYQYHYLKRPYEVEPLVAEGLPLITQKGTLVTIKLKKNVFYHSHPAFRGKLRELDAGDFEIAFKRLALRSLKSPGKSLFSKLIDGFDQYSERVGDDWRLMKVTDLAGVRAKDAHTLELRLLKSEPNIIYYLALNFVAPIPWELIEYEKNDLDKVLVGTGPYVLREHNDQKISMVSFERYRPDYYPTSGDRYANVQKLLDSSKKKIPFIQKLEFYINGNEEERWQKFINREIDMLAVPKTILSRLYDKEGNIALDLKQKQIEVKHFPTLANRWLAFNMSDPVVGKNKNLRFAIAYALDYKKYIEVLSLNTNLRANSIIAPGISGYLPSQDFRFEYNPEKAKEYLRQAGFTSPELMPTIVYSTRGNQGNNLLEANFIKASLEAIGLKVKINVLTFHEFIKKGRAGELMFFTDNWLFDYPDGENILQLLVSSNFPGINKSGYANPKIDALYLKLRATSNLDQRYRIIQEMENIFYEDLPWIPMMYESSFVVQYPEIKNFRKSSIIRNYVKYLKIEK